ncbi:MAG: glycerol-3-phosphate acyltransferase [Acidimicrobiales bacterium]
MLLALGVIAGYLVGTFPTAQLVARLVGADDPTTQGSGNPGASNMYRTAVWVAAVAGHVWPVTRRLRGGKGVATAGGGGLLISPLIGIACGLLFFAVVKWGRVAALGSLSIAIAFPIVSAIAGRPGWEVAVGAGVAAILVVRHQSNIRRLLARDEATV